MQIEENNYTIAVLGSGTMGQGIAQIAGTAGHPVLLYDVSQEQTQSAIENIAVRLKRSVNKEIYGQKMNSNPGKHKAGTNF